MRHAQPFGQLAGAERVDAGFVEPLQRGAQYRVAAQARSGGVVQWSIPEREA